MFIGHNKKVEHNSEKDSCQSHFGKKKVRKIERLIDPDLAWFHLRCEREPQASVIKPGLIMDHTGSYLSKALLPSPIFSFLTAGPKNLNLARARCRKLDSAFYSWIGNTGLNVFKVKINSLLPLNLF